MMLNHFKKVQFVFLYDEGTFTQYWSKILSFMSQNKKVFHMNKLIYYKKNITN